MSDDVRNFLERDKALCAQALDGGREVLIRAAELIESAESDARRLGVPLDDADLRES